jgi:hypothetical protein
MKGIISMDKVIIDEEEDESQERLNSCTLLFVRYISKGNKGNQ